MKNLKICSIAAFMMWCLVFIWVVNKSVVKHDKNTKHKHPEYKQEELEKLVELK